MPHDEEVHALCLLEAAPLATAPVFTCQCPSFFPRCQAHIAPHTAPYHPGHPSRCPSTGLQIEVRHAGCRPSRLAYILTPSSLHVLQFPGATIFTNPFYELEEEEAKAEAAERKRREKEEAAASDPLTNKVRLPRVPACIGVGARRAVARGRAQGLAPPRSAEKFYPIARRSQCNSSTPEDVHSAFSDRDLLITGVLPTLPKPNPRWAPGTASPGRLLRRRTGGSSSSSRCGGAWASTSALRCCPQPMPQPLPHRRPQPRRLGLERPRQGKGLRSQLQRSPRLLRQGSGTLTGGKAWWARNGRLGTHGQMSWWNRGGFASACGRLPAWVCVASDGRVRCACGASARQGFLVVG